MKLLLTISFLFTLSFAKAQTVTLPLNVAKKVQKELILKDSCIDMLNEANEEIFLLGKVIDTKDRVIDTLSKDNISLKTQVINEQNLKLTYKNLAEDCKTQFDVVKRQSDSYRKFTKVVAFLGTAVITGLTAVILFVK